MLCANEVTVCSKGILADYLTNVFSKSFVKYSLSVTTNDRNFCTCMCNRYLVYGILIISVFCIKEYVVNCIQRLYGQHTECVMITTLICLLNLIFLCYFALDVFERKNMTGRIESSWLGETIVSASCQAWLIQHCLFTEIGFSAWLSV
jgi:hypothetical protein